MSAPSRPETAPVDAVRLSLLLNELRLPAIKTLWPQFAETADKEGWPAARTSALRNRFCASQSSGGCQMNFLTLFSFERKWLQV